MIFTEMLHKTTKYINFVVIKTTSKEKINILLRVVLRHHASALSDFPDLLERS